MKLTDLLYDYPESLVATEPLRPSRVLWTEKGTSGEISVQELLSRIPAGDVFVLNNTKVLKRRVFAGDLEILFLAQQSPQQWQVLFPSRSFRPGDRIELPRGVEMTLLAKGRPQLVEVSQELTENYFEDVGELPLPPYIQKARQERRAKEKDQQWYQTAWAARAGSFAAPTASLHFSQTDIESLKKRRVSVLELTLHVGLGTFLAVTADDLNEHTMHSEYVEIANPTWREVVRAQEQGRKVWALGTTVARALESAERKLLTETAEGWRGETDLLIQPGFAWKRVDCLLTNFHQPQSTLLALVAGFAGLQTVRSAYQEAIRQKFRLFSYGDLSVWIR